MLIYVKDAKYIEEYKIDIQFTNGCSKIVDLEKYIQDGEVFKPLQDLTYFKSFTVNHDTETIEWSNGADFAPAFLFECS